MSLSGNSIWIGLLIFVLLMIVAIRFIWPTNHLFISKNKLVRQISKKILLFFIVGFFLGWGILAVTLSIGLERITALVVLALIGISCGILVWWKIPQWFNLTYNNQSGAEKFEIMLDQVNLFYDLEYEQKQWLKEEKYTKLGKYLLKDDISRKLLMGLVSSVIFLLGLAMIYDIYVIGGSLPLLILPGIKGVLLGPIIFAFDRSLVHEEKKFAHLLLQE